MVGLLVFATSISSSFPLPKPYSILAASGIEEELEKMNVTVKPWTDSDKSGGEQHSPDSEADCGGGQPKVEAITNRPFKVRPPWK